MFTALLLAVAVAGQSADEPVAKKAKPSHATIDAAYVPQANDRALLGTYDHRAPETEIGRTACYSSVENLRKSWEALDEEPEDGGVSTSPDGYEVRACTPVFIKDRLTMTYTKDGEPKKLGVVRIEILDGEFKGKDLFAVRYDVFRFVGDYFAADRAKLMPRKRSGRREAQAAISVGEAKLMLMDLTTNSKPTSKYVTVDGRVRCTSDVPLAFVKFTISFEDASGKLVRSENGFCSPHNLNPGDLGSISVMAENDPRYARIKIDFKDSDKALPWVDQSGTNAHQ
jgi:hypothetical protein